MIKCEPISLKEFQLEKNRSVFPHQPPKGSIFWRKNIDFNDIRYKSIKSSLTKMTGLLFYSPIRVSQIVDVSEYFIEKVIKCGFIKYFIFTPKKLSKNYYLIPETEVEKVERIKNGEKVSYDIPGIIQEEFGMSYKDFVISLQRYKYYKVFIYKCLTEGYSFEELLELFYRVAPVDKVARYLKKRTNNKREYQTLSKFCKKKHVSIRKAYEMIESGEVECIPLHRLDGRYEIIISFSKVKKWMM